LRFGRRSKLSGSRPHRTVDVVLVSSAGGHLMQLHLLRAAWNGLDHVWVTHDKDDARSILKGERVFFAHGPTTRNIPNLLRNLVFAVRLLARLRPKAIVTTGAGIAVPFAWIGRLLGVKVVYIESLTRVERLSLSGRLIAPVANRLYVQWPELLQTAPSARYAGTVLGSR